MNKGLVSTSLLAIFFGSVFCATSAAQEPNPQTIWNVKRLSKTPAFRWGKAEGEVQEVFFAGEPYQGKATTVFAYVGRPQGTGPFPGIVLVHGGGGQAFKEWARHWAKRGYVSIAMDTAGNGPGKKRLPDGGPDQSHPFKFREFDDKSLRDMWTYHAVSDVILSHSLLLSLPEVDKEKTAITGISWGGYLTCITAGVDHRFKAAVPVYGCGFLHDNSVWKDSTLAELTPDSRKLWIQKFDPGQHVGRCQCPILFFNGTNDFAYPLDSYRKTIEQVAPKWVTTAIHLNLRHGHIWTFPIVDRFVDSVLLGKKQLIRLGEIRRNGKIAYARFLGDRKVTKAELLYTKDKGAWQKRKWEVVPAKLDGDRVELQLDFATDVEYFFQLTDEQGNKTSTTHETFVASAVPTNHATLSMPKLENDFYDWYQRHADALRIKDEIDPEIVLIGDSITHMWGGRPLQRNRANGLESWKELFADKALNLGFGWDRTQNVLWRIHHGELDGLKPKYAVIHIGTNNLAGTRNHVAGTPRQIAEGILEVVSLVEQKLPETKVILMAIFPRGEKPDHPAREKIKAINAILKSKAKSLELTLLDINSKLLDDNGVFSRELAGDFLHPSEKGYRVWAHELRKVLDAKDRKGR